MVRRPTTPVTIGGITIGGTNPIRIQSMATVDTMLTEQAASQAESIINAGAEILRFTTQGVRQAENLGEIHKSLRAKGIDTPLVADVHFNPKAAFAAAELVEKVRINPGNFVDPGRTFKKIEFTDAEYAAEVERVGQALIPFLDLCKKHNTAIRIGVNHGSLSDRIMSRYGDTPDGIVESAMEFLRVCQQHHFTNVVISIKASNVAVMVESVHKLVAAMDREQMHFPLHLGVTEAGDGEDARIKSALGIGSLLAEGIGDTIRVSLSEAPENELPVARQIVDYIELLAAAPALPSSASADAQLRSKAIGKIGGQNLPVVVGADQSLTYYTDATPDFFLEDKEFAASTVEVDAIDIISSKACINSDSTVVLLTTTHKNTPESLRQAINIIRSQGHSNPIVASLRYDDMPTETAMIHAAIDLGSLLLNKHVDGIMLHGNAFTPAQAAATAFTLLQSARLRMSHTDYIACPGCGRTLFNLQTTLAAVKQATSHLKSLKIGVMGCIVNGPGEMADADYGYVGAGPGRVSLYRAKECIEKNIPEAEAVERLIQLIKSDGRWQ